MTVPNWIRYWCKEMTQDTRLIRLSASFIDDSCVATELHGTEELSSPFQFHVSFLSETLELSGADIIGQKISIAIHDQGRNEAIYRHGRVNQLVLEDVSENGVRYYQVSVVPGLWFLSQSKTYRIFENKTGLEIVEEILSSYGAFCSFETKANATYISREYCVQFNESDLEFAQRLLAEDGIHYYFTFEQSEHKLVLTDQASGFMDCAQKKVIKRGLSRTEGEEGAVIMQWSRTLNYHSQRVEQLDYNQDTPKNFYNQNLTTTSAFAQNANNTVQNYACYNFKTNNSNCHDFDVGYNKLLTKTRMEAMEAQHNVAHGSSNCASFQPGGRFEIVHNVTSECGNYLLWQVTHSANNNIDAPANYENSFRCIPADVPARPEIQRFKQRMPGPQMAKVTSLVASGSSPDADPQRMVKVQFPWDSEHNTCKLRVLQGYAGSGWGASFVPREGQEVLVDFINGDPDRPIIIGAMYNNDNQGPKYTSTQSGWVTQNNANEFRFDDAGGAEEIYLNAGKDMNFVITNNETGQIKNNQSLSVSSNRDVSVGANETKAVTGNQTTTIQGSQTLSVSKNQTSTVMINSAETVGAARELTIGGVYQVTVGGAMNETVGAVKAEEVGASRSLMVARNMSEKVGKNRDIDVGDTSNHKAKKINITAEDELTIKVGKASISMKKDGTIQISGKDINLKASGKINVKASSNVVIKGSKVGIN